MEKDLMLYQPIITDIKEIISAGQQNAYNAANIVMVLTYWHIGKRIVEQEQEGSERAEYGKRLLKIGAFGRWTEISVHNTITGFCNRRKKMLLLRK